jgi:hypothetical protein
MRHAVLVSVLIALFGGAVGSAGARLGGAPSVDVYFLQGEQLVAVKRPGSTIRAAATALLEGPTQPELARKVRSYVPAGTPLRSVALADGVATVDLGGRFAVGRDAEDLDARIAQLVFTVTSVPGVKSVRVLVAGGVPLGLFPGFALSQPFVRRAPWPLDPLWTIATRRSIWSSFATPMIAPARAVERAGTVVAR